MCNWGVSATIGLASALISSIVYFRDHSPDNPEYAFNGVICDARADFLERDLGRTNILRVRLPEDMRAEFFDYSDDFTLDAIKIISGGNTSFYSLESPNPVSRDFVTANQPVFDSYLERIVAANTGQPVSCDIPGIQAHR